MSHEVNFRIVSITSEFKTIRKMHLFPPKNPPLFYLYYMDFNLYSKDFR
jgi:hypothetical protein